MSEQAKQIEKKLGDVIARYGNVITAYSGGVDSTVVAAAARRVLGREKGIAAIGDSASLPRHELEEARQIARQLDMELVEVNPGEQDDPDYQANAGNRCYFCKSHLYESLHALAEERGFAYIANGTNKDDFGDHRPGLDAARERRVISPLVEAGMGKAEVRIVAEYLKLPNADKPAAACLASRIPYGTRVTAERLSMVERAEDVLREMGFAGFRVRHHETMARLEIPVEQLGRMVEEAVRGEVVKRLNAIGYAFVTMDLAGYRSGSGNALLSGSETGAQGRSDI